MKPADFGTNFQTTYDTMNSMADRNRKKVKKIIFLKILLKKILNFWTIFIKDPLFNNGLVRNNPTPRQEQILSQLASLKQVNIH